MSMYERAAYYFVAYNEQDEVFQVMDREQKTNYEKINKEDGSDIALFLNSHIIACYTKKEASDKASAANSNGVKISRCKKCQSYFFNASIDDFCEDCTEKLLKYF